VAARAGLGHAIIPAVQPTRKRLGHLRDLVDLLRSWPPTASPRAIDRPKADLVDLRAEHPGRSVLEIAAAGGHHLALIGAPGTGKAMLANRLPGLLPDLDETTAAEVANLYRAAGLAERAPGRRPPWQAPHHTISLPALLGSPRRPGAISLAHGGVLFCDDAGELRPAAVNALTGVLDRRRIVLGPAPVIYPARLQLVLASTGCPQPGPAGSDCTCAPGAHRRYLARLSRLLDRIDIHALLPATNADPATTSGEASARVAARVARARTVSATRWAGRGNAQVGSDALRASLSGVDPDHFALLRERVGAGALSARGAVSVLRLAWTIADLAGRREPTAGDVAEAVALRTAPVAT
jgi:magnesium chelatase family protein